MIKRSDLDHVHLKQASVQTCEGAIQRERRDRAIDIDKVRISNIKKQFYGIDNLNVIIWNIQNVNITKVHLKL